MHITDDELVAHYYGELSDADEAQTAAHIEACEQCRGNLGRLKRVMAAIDTVTMPEPSAEFETRMWQRLRPSLASDVTRAGRDAWSRTSAWKLGGWGTMAAGLLIAAFLAGRMWPANSATGNRQPAAGTGQPTIAGSPGSSPGGDGAAEEPVRERVLLVDLGDHLDRTEHTLVEFVSRADVARDVEGRTRTDDLVAANRLYRGTAEVTGDRAITDVLDDLERVLIEIAGVPANASATELDAIRRRIDTRDLLFKLRVMRMELEQRASDPRPAKRQGPTT